MPESWGRVRIELDEQVKMHCIGLYKLILDPASYFYKSQLLAIEDLGREWTEKYPELIFTTETHHFNGYEPNMVYLRWIPRQPKEAK